MRAARYLTGWAEVRACGAAPEKLLKSLADRGVPFWQISPVADYTAVFRLPVRRLGILTALAAAAGCECAVTAVHGLPALARKARRRVSLAALLAAAAVCLLLSLSRVWDIEITGNETIPDGVIRQALAECGVDIGADWTAFSQDGIRNGMILRQPQIRWMTVTMQGCRAHVIIREKRLRVEPIPEKEYAAVTADKAGLVTAVHALRGTAQTGPGRAVLPGETIIAGVSTGRFGVQGPIRAVGYADLRTWHELMAKAPVTVSEKQSTGRKTTCFALILGNLRINFYKGSSICPADCDKIIERYELSRAGIFTLPVALEKTVFTGYDTRSAPAPELRGELEVMLYDALAARIGTDGSVTESRCTASEADGVICVTLRAECAERAGTPVPLTGPEVDAILSKIPQTEDRNT